MELSNSLAAQLSAKLDSTSNTDAPTHSEPQGMASRVQELVEKLAPGDDVEVSPEQTLTDLGFDSLTKIELAVRLERLIGQRLPEDEVAAMLPTATVQNLCDFMDSHSK